MADAQPVVAGFNWIAELVVPIAKTSIWAGTAYLVGRHLISKFQGGINKTLERLRKAGPAEFDAPPAPQPERAALAPTAESLPASDHAMLAPFEDNIRRMVAGKTGSEREDHIVQIAAASQLAWAWEVINSNLLGSQLALLLVLNGQSMPLSEIRRNFYDPAAARHPDYYADYAFEAWLHWFTDVAKFGIVSADRLEITDMGREFLKYFVARGHTVSRFG